MKRDFSWWFKFCVNAAPKEVGHFVHSAAVPASLLRSWSRSAFKSTLFKPLANPFAENILADARPLDATAHLDESEK
jgi:hypothetical protein